MNYGWETIAQISTAVGVFFAALSVLYAAQSFRRENEREMLDVLKVVAVKAKVSANKIDRLLNWPLFLEMAENFSLRVKKEIGEVSSRDEFIKRFSDESVVARLPRLHALSFEESKLYNSLRDELDSLEISAVELSQRFPVSGHIVLMCSRILSNTVTMYSHMGDIYSKALDPEVKDEFWETVDGNGIDDWARDVSTLASDLPMASINADSQVVINDTKEILSIVADQLSSLGYEQLRKQERFEKSVSKHSIDATDTITGDIRACLGSLRAFFGENNWDRAISAHARLEAKIK